MAMEFPLLSARPCSALLPSSSNSSSHTLLSFFSNRPCHLPKLRSSSVPISISNASAADTGSVEPASEAPLPASSDTSFSLLSYDNIRKALVGEDMVTVDHYGRLGVPRGATMAEVAKSFRDKCQDVMQGGLDEESTRNQLRLLKESFEVLTSEPQRRLYDWGVLQTAGRDGPYVWPFEADITQKSFVPAPPKLECYGDCAQFNISCKGQAHRDPLSFWREAFRWQHRPHLSYLEQCGRSVYKGFAPIQV